MMGFPLGCAYCRTFDHFYCVTVESAEIMRQKGLLAAKKKEEEMKKKEIEEEKKKYNKFVRRTLAGTIMLQSSKLLPSVNSRAL